MNKRKKGFSLIEVIAAVAIMSILFLAVFSMTMQSNKMTIDNSYTINKTRTMQGISDFIFSESNDYFKEKLNVEENTPQSIVIESNNLNGILNILGSEVNQKEKGNVYINSNGEKNIKYIVHLNVSEAEKEVYTCNIALYTLKNGYESNGIYNEAAAISYGEENGVAYEKEIVNNAYEFVDPDKKPDINNKPDTSNKPKPGDNNNNNNENLWDIIWNIIWQWIKSHIF